MVWRRVSFKAAAVAAALLCAAAPTGAQSHYRSRISIGGHAGATMSRIDISPSVPQSMLQGYMGSVRVRYAEEKLFGLVAELGVAQRGWKEKFEDSPLQYRRQFTYLTLPVMTQIIFGGRRVKCFVNLGPEVSYMLGESTSANFDYTRPTAAPGWPDVPRQTEQMVMPVKNKFDYGITGGVGCEFYVQPRHSLTLEVRYYFGLGNVFPSSKADTFSASRCTSIEAAVGYYFKLK
ncbi:MAG: PorT family protein [Bacteroides sp.]|nr:PorT family protein [Bacteroides sp.]MCM1095450.1 PorT family protein [Terasakiella sp.]